MPPADHAALSIDCRWAPFAGLTVQQLYDVMVLRQEVFVVEQACVFRDADGMDQAAQHGLVYAQNQNLKAYARILPPGLKFSLPCISRVVVHPAARGQGLGALLMECSLQECERLYPGQAVRIAAQARLERFYAGLGFTSLGAPYDEDGICHIDMVRGPWSEAPPLGRAF